MPNLVVRGLKILLTCAVFAVVTGSAAVAHAEWARPEVQLTTNDQQQWKPDVSGSWAAFLDCRDPAEYGEEDDPDQLFEIRAVNLDTMTEKKITPSKTAMWEPAVAGNYVVWPDYGNGTTTKGIWYHNLKTGTHKRLPVKAGHNVEIAGHRIVYSYDTDVYTYNLWTGKHIRVTDNDKSHSPDISGTKIVYAYYTGSLNFDIYVYDILTGLSKRLTSASVDQVSNPAISGDTVVWQDDRNGNDDIYSYNLATNTEKRITTNASDQTYPAISGNWIVWQDWRDGNNQIYLYDLITNTEHRMTHTATNQSSPAISGARIVYDDGRNGGDLYLTRAAVPVITAIAPTSIAFDSRATLTGALKSAGGFLLPGKTVTLQISKDKKAWTSTTTTVTAGGGVFSVESPQLRTARYVRASYSGDADYPGAVSSAVLVRPRLLFSSAPKFKTYTLKYGKTYAVWGYFKPEHSSGSKQIRIRAYRYNGSKWVYKRTYSTKTSNTSASAYTKYKGYVRLPSKGTWRLRAYHATDSKNAKSYSDYRKVKVK